MKHKFRMIIALLSSTRRGLSISFMTRHPKRIMLFRRSFGRHLYDCMHYATGRGEETTPENYRNFLKPTTTSKGYLLLRIKRTRRQCYLQVMRSDFALDKKEASATVFFVCPRCGYGINAPKSHELRSCKLDESDVHSSNSGQ